MILPGWLFLEHIGLFIECWHDIKVHQLFRYNPVYVICIMFSFFTTVRSPL